MTSAVTIPTHCLLVDITSGWDIGSSFELNNTRVCECFISNNIDIEFEKQIDLKNNPNVDQIGISGVKGSRQSKTMVDQEQIDPSMEPEYRNTSCTSGPKINPKVNIDKQKLHIQEQKNKW
jgi:hypothetical protein